MFNRNFTIIINWILENLVPPICREWRWLMHVIIYPVYGKHTNLVLDFKGKLPYMTPKELDEYYKTIVDAPINRRPTDLNKKCQEFILHNLVGQKIIDCGCGRGFLIEQIIKKGGFEVYGADIEPQNVDGAVLINKRIEELDFDDNTFDTVLCCHTLEHIVEYKTAIDNLIRICKKRLIIVVPCQRNYKYTADLHVNFLPYMYNFKMFVNINEAKYLKCGGDFLCVYDKNNEVTQ